MISADEILQTVTFKPEHKGLAGNLQLEHKLGFLYEADARIRHSGEVALFGFGWSGWHKGTKEVADSYMSPTSIFDFKDTAIRNNLDMQGKGMGARLYNTDLAVGGTLEDPEYFGLYRTLIRPGHVKNMCRFYDDSIAGTVIRGMKHVAIEGLGVALGTEKRTSTKRVLGLIESRFNGYDAVLYNQTPDARVKKTGRGYPDSPIPEKFMVITRSNELLIKVGDVQR